MGRERVTVRRVKRGAVRERLKIVRGGQKGGRGLGKVTEEKIAGCCKRERWEAMKGEEEEVSTEASEWGTVERHTIEQTTKKEQREGEAPQVCWGNCSSEDLLPQD